MLDFRNDWLKDAGSGQEAVLKELRTGKYGCLAHLTEEELIKHVLSLFIRQGDVIQELRNEIETLRHEMGDLEKRNAELFDIADTASEEAIRRLKKRLDETMVRAGLFEALCEASQEVTREMHGYAENKLTDGYGH